MLDIKSYLEDAIKGLVIYNDQNQPITEESIFVNEAHFQLELAVKLSEKLPNDYGVQLEYHPTNQGQQGNKRRFDLIVVKNGEGDNENKDNNPVALIELKYKTKKHEVWYKHVKFTLKDQTAYTDNVGSFIRDIQKCEEYYKEKSVVGYAVFLTNDSTYWGQDCRIGQNRRWSWTTTSNSKEAPKTTIIEKSDEELSEQPKIVDDNVCIRNKYKDLEWHDYCGEPSEEKVKKNGQKYKSGNGNEFKYIIAEINYYPKE